MIYDKVSARTAMSRKTLSLPAKWLHEQGLIKGDALDYGCGKGADAFLIGMDNYDPYFFPKKPTKQYETITCTYVLNVVKPIDWADLILEMMQYLAPGGTLYIAVRRDLKKEGITSKGTQQWNVQLSFPVTVEKKGKFCIYEVKK